MNTNTNTNASPAAVIPAEARELALKGLKSAVQHEMHKSRAQEASKGAYTTLTECAIACGSAAALDALWEGLQVEIRTNVGGLGKSLGAKANKKGEYNIPRSASTAMALLLDAMRRGVSLYEPDDKGEPTEKPRSFNGIRKATQEAKAKAEAAAILQSNPALAAALDRHQALADAVTAYKANLGYAMSNPKAEPVTAMEAAATAFIKAVEAVAELAIAADREKAEAEKAEKAGDSMAKADRPEPKAKPERKAASK